MSIIEESLVPFIILAIGLIIVNSRLLKGYYITLFDQGYMMIITISLIIADVVMLYVHDMMTVVEFCKNFSMIGTCLIIFFLMEKVFSRNRLVQSLKNYIIIPAKKQEIIAFWIIYAMFLSTTMYFSYSLMGASMGDERIILAAKNRILDIIRNGSDIIKIMAVVLWLKSKSNIYLIALIFSFLISMFGGSKGILLSYISIYLLYRYIIGKPVSNIGMIFVVGLSIIGMLITLILFGGEMEVALSVVMTRICFPGDAYLFAYVWGDYNQITGFYDAFDYVMHPFYKLIGERGYEYPLGVALNGIVNGNYEGYGPNALLPILANVLLENDIFVALIFIVLVTVISVVPIILFTRVKMKNEFLRLFIVLSLYYNIFFIFIEIGLWEQKVISLIIVCTIVKVFLMIIGNYGCLKKEGFGEDDKNNNYNCYL